jgi:hypothetical protein
VSPAVGRHRCPLHIDEAASTQRAHAGLATPTSRRCSASSRLASPPLLCPQRCVAGRRSSPRPAHPSVDPATRRRHTAAGIGS